MNITVSPELANEILPNAVNTAAWQLYLLGFEYVIVATLSIAEFIRRVRHPKFSFLSSKIFFLLLAFISMAFRAVLTLVPFHPWSKFALVFVGLVVPLYLQLLLFSVLIIFFVEGVLTTRGTEKSKRKLLVYLSFGGTVIVSFVACIFFSYWISTYDLTPENYDQHITILMLFFGLLVIGLGIFSFRANDTVTRSTTLKRLRIKTKFMSIVIGIYSMFVVLRIIWGVLAYVGLNPIQNELTEWLINSHSKSAYHSAYLVFYTFFEVLPIAFVYIALKIIQPLYKKQVLSSSGKYDEESPLLPAVETREFFWCFPCCHRIKLHGPQGTF
jgi:MFS family permease